MMPLFLVVGILGACATTVGIDLGAMLGVDAAGHFKKDLTYVMTSGEEVTLKTDGSFESLSYEYEFGGDDLDGDGVTNEGKVQTDGMRGTYVCAADTMVFTVDFSSVYNGIVGDWRPNTNENDVESMTLNGAAFEHTLYINQPYSMILPVFVKTETANTWTGTVTMVMADEYKSFMSMTETAVIDVENSNFDLTIHQTVMGTNGVEIAAMEMMIDAAIIKLTPDGVSWKKGESVGFLIRGVMKERAYMAGAWSEWETDPEENEMNFPLTHMGDFILVAPMQVPMRDFPAFDKMPEF